MEVIVIGILILLIGIVCGSFYSLAIYRLPINEDIIKKPSFCPSCKHKLKFLDLIPILSYITLKGKCRYCKNQIKTSYLTLEIFSGISFLLFFISLKFSTFDINFSNIIYIVIMLLYFSSLFIIAGIDKEKVIIPKNLILFGLCISVMYIIYIFVLLNQPIYNYITYLGLLLIAVCIDTYILKTKRVPNYATSLIILVIYMLFFNTINNILYTLILALVFIILQGIIDHKKIKELKVPVGYWLCISNIAVIISTNFIINFNII